MARRLLAAMQLLHIDQSLLDRAGELGPPELRSLDALHLAAALSVGPDRGAVFTYDSRLRESAICHGLEVLAAS